jgi:hypothetical protein
MKTLFYFLVSTFIAFPSSLWSQGPCSSGKSIELGREYSRLGGEPCGVAPVVKAASSSVPRAAAPAPVPVSAPVPTAIPVVVPVPVPTAAPAVVPAPVSAPASAGVLVPARDFPTRHFYNLKPSFKILPNSDELKVALDLVAARVTTRLENGRYSRRQAIEISKFIDQISSGRIGLKDLDLSSVDVEFLGVITDITKDLQEIIHEFVQFRSASVFALDTLACKGLSIEKTHAIASWLRSIQPGQCEFEDFSFKAFEEKSMSTGLVLQVIEQLLTCVEPFADAVDAVADVVAVDADFASTDEMLVDVFQRSLPVLDIYSDYVYGDSGNNREERVLLARLNKLLVPIAFEPKSVRELGMPMDLQQRSDRQFAKGNFVYAAFYAQEVLALRMMHSAETDSGLEFRTLASRVCIEVARDLRRGCGLYYKCDVEVARCLLGFASYSLGSESAKVLFLRDFSNLPGPLLNPDHLAAAFRGAAQTVKEKIVRDKSIWHREDDAVTESPAGVVYIKLLLKAVEYEFCVGRPAEKQLRKLSAHVHRKYGLGDKLRGLYFWKESAAEFKSSMGSRRK